MLAIQFWREAQAEVTTDRVRDGEGLRYARPLGCRAGEFKSPIEFGVRDREVVIIASVVEFKSASLFGVALVLVPFFEVFEGPRLAAVSIKQGLQRWRFPEFLGRPQQTTRPGSEIQLQGSWVKLRITHAGLPVSNIDRPRMPPV